MDLYLYFELIVYPQLNYILAQYKLGKITKEVATNIAHGVCDIKEVIMEHAQNIAPVMVTDTLKWFLTEVEKVC